MKIAKHGHVIITEQQIRIEGWLMAPEPDDPQDAKPEELLTALATEWALKRLTNAINSESMRALLESSKRIKAALDKQN
jgi:hypothetical protein